MFTLAIVAGVAFASLSPPVRAEAAPTVRAEAAPTVAISQSAVPVSGVLGGVLAEPPRPCSEWGTSADFCRQLRAAAARMRANNKPLRVTKPKECTELRGQGKGEPKKVPCPRHKFTDGGIWDSQRPGKTNNLPVVGGNDDGSACYSRLFCDHPAPYDNGNWGTGGSGGIDLGGSGNSDPPPSNNGGPTCYFKWAAGC
jgi:hypothetical protein